MRQWGVNNLPKVVAQQRHGRGSNPQPLDRKSDALPLSHRALSLAALRCLVLVLPVLAIGDCKHCKNTFDYLLLYCFINIMY